jgi:hypothetical protein
VVCAVASTSAFGIIVDLTTAGSSGTIGSANFQQMDQQPTGTGVIDSFLRIRKTGNEAAYNTSGNLSSPFNQLGGSQYNRDLLLSSVPIVNGSYQFLLDINQINSGTKPLLSLNQLQVFLTDTPGQTGGSWNPNPGTDGRLDTTGLTHLNSVYDMNPGGGTANGVKLDYSLNPGSGAGDMYLYLPTSLFDTANGQYVFLYSQFGNPPGEYGSNDGFEEWAVLTPVVIPEPSTMIAGALLLLPFGVTTLRFVRKNRAA